MRAQQGSVNGTDTPSTEDTATTGTTTATAAAAAAAADAESDDDMPIALARKRKLEEQVAAPRVPVTGQPRLVTGGTLRDYQLTGLRWLVSQHDSGAGSILGDEMGLGKTLQVISFLAFLSGERSEGGPHLIVAPLSVLPTWAGELQRWTPTLRAIIFHGPQHERSRIKRTVLAHGDHDIIVTTYEMLLAVRIMCCVSIVLSLCIALYAAILLLLLMCVCASLCPS